MSLQVAIEGRWSVDAYQVGEKTFATRGMILITSSHLMSTVIFDVAPGHRRASANSGPYHVEGQDIVLIQDMQLHYDTQDTAEHLLTEGVPERIACRTEEDRLTLTFPSGNHFTCRRA